MDRFLKILLLITVLGSLPASAQPDIKAISDGTVRVVSRSATKIGTGSGFFANRDGYIITNQHVIRNGISISIIRSGSKREIPARVIGESRPLDLAILKIDTGNLSPLPVSVSIPDAGADVWALGFPGNADRLGEQVRPTITKGILSNVFNGSWHNNVQLRIIQHSAGISPGSSGGPLIDNCGRVVGVNSKGSGSRVLHDARGNVVDVFAGTQIYFSSHIEETIKFLAANGVSVEIDEAACLGDRIETAETTDDIDKLRREVDASRAIASESAEASQNELRRLEDQLDAATLLNIEQNKKISSVMQVTTIASAMGALIILLLAFRRPKAHVIRVPQSSAYVRAESKSFRIERTNKSREQTARFMLIYSNGYIEDKKRVVLDRANTEGFVIGQNEELCDLTIDDPRLSPRHVRLSIGQSGSIMLEDLNSKLGTMIGGQKIKSFRPITMRMNSTFSCGTLRFQLKSI